MSGCRPGHGRHASTDDVSFTTLISSSSCLGLSCSLSGSTGDMTSARIARRTPLFFRVRWAGWPSESCSLSSTRSWPARGHSQTPSRAQSSPLDSRSSHMPGLCAIRRYSGQSCGLRLGQEAVVGLIDSCVRACVRAWLTRNSGRSVLASPRLASRRKRAMAPQGEHAGAAECQRQSGDCGCGWSCWRCHLGDCAVSHSACAAHRSRGEL